MTEAAAAAPRVRPVAYPILIGTAYVLWLVAASGASPFATLRLLLGAVALTVGISVVCTVAMRDRHRGGLLAVALILLLVAGHEPLRIAACGLGVVAIVVERLVATQRPSRIPLPLISRVGNAAGLILLLAIAVKAGQDGTIGAIAYDIAAEGGSVFRPAAAVATTGDKPDIYVIMLDGYLRPDKQLALFGHDDSAFVEDLEQRGFDVASASRSNYLLTILSLSSALNMRHLEDQAELAALPSTDVRHIRGARLLLNDNLVFRTLRGFGYEIVTVSAGFEQVALRQADRYIDTGELNEVELLTFRQTLLGAIVSFVAPDTFARAQRDRIESAFEVTAQLARETHDGPRLHFVHVAGPHAPIVFDADGRPVPPPNLQTFYEESGLVLGLTREEFGAAYSGEVDYLNRRVVSLIDDIVASERNPPVILLLSDHGSASGVDFADLEHADLDERTANLFAALTPGVSGIYDDDITLVNAFGPLLNAYFGTSFPKQPDTLYSWTGDSVFNLVPLPWFPGSPAALPGPDQ